jgi:hypothetical protein
MKKSKIKMIITILLIALVLCLVFFPVAFSTIFTEAYDVSILVESSFLILFEICFFPFTKIILFTQKLE